MNSLSYKPICPLGHKDCVYDPSYIKLYVPGFYQKRYGNMTLDQAAMLDCCKENNDCYQPIEKPKISEPIQPFYIGKKQELVEIPSNSEDCIVHYDKERRMYRISIFEDNHFVDEFWFEEFKGE